MLLNAIEEAMNDTLLSLGEYSHQSLVSPRKVFHITTYNQC